MYLAPYQRSLVPLPKAACNPCFGRKRSVKPKELVLNGQPHHLTVVNADVLEKFEASQRALAELMRVRRDPALSSIKDGYEQLISALLAKLESRAQCETGGQRLGSLGLHETQKVERKKPAVSSHELKVDASYHQRERQLVSTISKVLDDLATLKKAQQLHCQVFERLKAEGIPVGEMLKACSKPDRPAIQSLQFAS